MRLKVDLIYTSTAPAALAVKRATTVIPIVFANVHDPVAVGLVTALARPGGNATGLTNVDAELAQKRLAILKEVIPSARVVGLLKPPANPQVSAVLSESHSAAKVLGLSLQVAEVDGPEAFARALAGMKTARVGAVVFVPHPLFYTHRVTLVELSTHERLPLMGFSREFTHAGALFAYGVNIPQTVRGAADYIVRILEGAKPASLPVEQPTKFELVINLKTAPALGLTIPPLLLLRADQVIE